MKSLEVLYGCELLQYIPDIKKWDITNLTNMNNILSGWNSLKDIQDISQWDKKIVSNNNYLISNSTKIRGSQLNRNLNSKNFANDYEGDVSFEIDKEPKVFIWELKKKQN